ncbi:hypothetical protein C8J57DRAFT_1503643 [Mycena rebaudengoi]|nr:hypothetical protein C8J57DRAFT_1503643 [Mycena rebaudengoi]
MAPTGGLSNKSKVKYGHPGSSRAQKQVIIPVNKSAALRAAGRRDYNSTIAGLSFVQRDTMLDLQQDEEMPDTDNTFDLGGPDNNNDEWETIGAGIHLFPPGEEGMLQRNTGGEAIMHQMMEGMKPGCGDPRTRSYRVQKEQDKWQSQLPLLIYVYLQYKDLGPVDVVAEAQEWPLYVLGLDESGCRLFSHTPGVVHSNQTLLHNGYIGSSPEQPAIAFSLCTLEIYRQIHRTCPCFTINSLATMLTNLHHVPRRKYLAEQLMNAYDAYLAILREVQLSSLDGNNSLKLVDSTFRSGHPRFDNRQSTSFRWLTPSEVDKYHNEVKNALKIPMTTAAAMATVTESLATSSPLSPSTSIPEPTTAPPHSATQSSSTTEVSFDDIPDGLDDTPVNDDPDGDIAWLNVNEMNPNDLDELQKCVNTCVERWKATGPEARKKMFALFAIAGIFISVCRHGHVVLMCDMIRSGELMKYPLAIIAKILERYGKDAGIGYDIMCAFFKTLLRSSLGQKVVGMRLRGIVPAFHGHAHNWLCQLGWHPMYVEGAGLEDFKECERTFCQSNNLVGATRLSMPFHRQQQINGHFLFHDQDKHAASGNFIFQNYCQAIEKITGNTLRLQVLKEQLLTTSVHYEQDLKDERAYLEGLMREPEGVQNTVDYIELLGKLQNATDASTAAEKDFKNLDALIILKGIQKKEIAAIRTRYQTTHTRLLLMDEEISRFEEENGYKTRWTTASKEYNDALALTNERRYRRSIDKLEHLVVQRFLELTKLSMSGIAYKLHEKIGKALKTRADTIHRALTEYNAAVASLNPPHDQLIWAEVIQTATLAEFDLLKDTQADRAKEEIRCLNIEITRIITFGIDIHIDFHRAVATTYLTEPHLARALSQQWIYENCINQSIVQRLIQTSHLPGFTGTLFPGQRVGRDPALNSDAPLPPWATHSLGLQQVTVEYEEEDENDDTARELVGLDSDQMIQLMENLEV